MDLKTLNAKDDGKSYYAKVKVSDSLEFVSPQAGIAILCKYAYRCNYIIILFRQSFY